MSKKFLGRVIAGAALGGASLLVFAPGSALADGGHSPEGGAPMADGSRPANDSTGRIFTRPGTVKAGQDVVILQVCRSPQGYPFAWSQPTGKIQLKPVDPGKRNQDYKQEQEYGDYKNDKAYQEYRDYLDYQDYKRYKRYPAPDPTSTSAPTAPATPPPGPGTALPEPSASPSPEPSVTATPEASEPAEPGMTVTGQVESPLLPPVDASPMPQPTGPPVLETPPPNQPAGSGGGMMATGDDDPQTPDAWSTEGGMGSAEQDSWYGQDGMNYDDEGSPVGPGASGAAPSAPTRPHSNGGTTYGGEEQSSQDWSAQDGQDGADEDWASQDEQDWAGQDGAQQDGMQSYGEQPDGQPRFTYWAKVTLGDQSRPGTYDLKGSCADGELSVLPNGWVDGGDGGARTGGSDRNLASGVGMLGAAALGGIVLVRRRRTDGALL